MNQISYSGPDAEIQREIQDKITLLSKIADIAKQDNDINILFEQFLDTLIEITNLDSGIVKLFDPSHTFFLQSETFHGISQKFLEKSSGNPIGGCLCSVAMAQKSIAYTADIARDRRFSCPLCKSENFKFVICIPITCQNESIGVIQLASHKIVKIKPVDLALMESAGKIISNAMEYNKLIKSNNYNEQTNSIYLKIFNDPILTVDKDMKIIDISEYALKLLDIPKEHIIHTPLSSILHENIVKQLPILAESKTSVKANIGSKTKFESQLKVYPLMDETTGDYTHYLINFSIAKQENSIQERFENSTKHLSDFMSILSNMDIKNNVQDFCDSSMSKINSLLPIIQSTYLIYYYDQQAKELQLIANSGFENDFIQKNAIISSENYEYKNVLNTKKIYSIYKEETGWEIIVPLVYSGESRGIMILLSEVEPKDSLEENENFYAIGSLVAVIMEKQALYDSLENNSTLINDVKSNPNIVSNAISAPSTSATERIKKLFEAALYITKCQDVTLTIKKGTEAKKYYLHEGEELKLLTSEVEPNSREAYVLENGEALYSPSENDNELDFTDDKENYKFKAVIPVIISNLIIATMTFNGNEINDDFPESLVNLIANLIFSNITLQQNKQKVKKLSDEKTNLETNIERLKELLKKQDDVKIRELTTQMLKIKSDKEILETEKQKLNDKIKIALENEEKQKQIATKNQKIIEELNKNILNLKTELKTEKENNEIIKQELEETIKQELEDKISIEENNNQKQIIEKYKNKIKELEADSEIKQKEFEKQLKEVKADSETKQKELEEQLKEVKVDSETKQKVLEEQLKEVKANSEIKQKVLEEQLKADSEIKQKVLEEQLKVDSEIKQKVFEEQLKADSEIKQKELEEQLKEVKANSEIKQKELEEQLKEAKANSETKQKELEEQLKEIKADSETKQKEFEEQLKEVKVESETKQKELEEQLKEVKADSEQKIKENENLFEEEKNAITSKYDDELKQKEIEKENIIAEYEKQINEIKQELSDKNGKTEIIKEAEEKIATLMKQSSDTIILSEEKTKKFLTVLSVQTKEIMQAIDMKSIKNIVNETGKILYKDYEDIPSESIDELTKEILSKKSIFREREYSIRLIWNSIADTAIRRLEEIDYVSKIKELIKVAK